jgi:phage shock protein A
MALINRISRLFTADMHAVLDRLEEPDVLLQHAVREMEEELARSAERLRVAEYEYSRLGERQRQVRAALVEIEAQVDVAFEAGNEGLARKLIKRKLETTRLDKHVAERGAVLEKALAERRVILGEQRERLDVMRQKAELFADEAHRGAARERGEQSDFAVGDDEVEVEWLRERQRRARS